MFFSLFTIITIIILIFAFTLHFKRTKKGLSWKIQMGVLFLLTLTLFIHSQKATKPVRIILLDLSLSYRSRLLSESQNPRNQLKEKILSFTKKESGKIGLALFAKNCQLIIEPTTPKNFSSQINLSPQTLQNWFSLVDPSETNLILAQDYLQQQYPAIEILLFSDGQLLLPKPSSFVSYSPQILDSELNETQILSIDGPSFVPTEQSFYLKIRVRGSPGTSKKIVLLKEKKPIFPAKKIEFTTTQEFQTFTFLCPPNSKTGPTTYTIQLLPKTQEIIQENNEKTWTILVEKQKPLLILSHTASSPLLKLFEGLPFALQHKVISDLEGETAPFLGFTAIFYFPAADPLPLSIEKNLLRYVKQGGSLLLFGTPWFMQVADTELEKILPVSCGGDPDEVELKMVLDISGSMNQIIEGGFSQLELCTHAISALIKKIPTRFKNRIKLQLWMLNDKAILVEPEQLLSLKQARGKTLLGKGLKENVVPSFGKQSHGKKMLFLFSDGETEDKNLFLEQGKILSKNKVHLVCLQLPNQKRMEGTQLLNQFAKTEPKGRVLQIESYHHLKEELFQVFKEETNLYFRAGTFEVDSGEVPTIKKGYARGKIRNNGVLKSSINTEPFLAFRSVDLGATGFLAVSPIQEQWAKNSSFTKYFETLIAGLNQFKTQEFHLQRNKNRIELYSKKSGPFVAFQGEQQWEFHNEGFGRYGVKIPNSCVAGDIKIFHKEQLIGVLSGETNPEIYNLFIHQQNLNALKTRQTKAFKEREIPYFFLWMALFLLFFQIWWLKWRQD